MDYKRGSLRSHEELKEYIRDNPELIGLDKKDIISIETEYPLIRRKNAIAKPDLVISYLHNRRIRKRFVEVKSGSCKRAKISLQTQLRKISNYIKYRKMHGEVIGVYPSANALCFLLP